MKLFKEIYLNKQLTIKTLYKLKYNNRIVNNNKNKMLLYLLHVVML